MGRSLDPRLFELNRSGAYNGHVPVTAINSCLAVIAALIHDASDVVMADERSASVGSLTWDGAEVNHQYSKGWDFERRFAAAVRHQVASDLRYFSLLRPWSELAIARSFAPLTAYHDAFVSCNRAYLLDAERRTQRWCGDCPKCRFTTLVLAPFLDRDKVVRIIDHDLLADPAQLGGFEALLGLEADKPLECVGEVEEFEGGDAAPVRERAVARDRGGGRSRRGSQGARPACVGRPIGAVPLGAARAPGPISPLRRCAWLTWADGGSPCGGLAAKDARRWRR